MDNKLFPDYEPPDFTDDQLKDAPVTDTLKTIAHGALKGVGPVLRGAGSLVAGGINTAGEALGFKPDLRAEDPFEASGITPYLSKSRSAKTQKALQGSQIGGDITDPSTYTFGDNPSLRGIGLQALDAASQVAPQLGLALATGGLSTPAQLGIGAGVGTLQGLGAGAEQQEQSFDQLSHDDLYKTYGAYRDLIDKGESPSNAKDKVRKLVSTGGAIGMGAVTGATQGLENVLVGALSRGKLKIPTNGPLTKSLVSGGAGALTESTQEVSEGVGARLGSNIAAQGNQSLTEGSFADAALGALGGGPIGAAIGAIQPDNSQGFEKPSYKIIPDADKIVKNRTKKGENLKDFIDSQYQDSGYKPEGYDKQARLPAPEDKTKLPSLAKDEIITFSDGSQARKSDLVNYYKSKGYSDDVINKHIESFIKKAKPKKESLPEYDPFKRETYPELINKEKFRQGLGYKDIRNTQRDKEIDQAFADNRDKEKEIDAAYQQLNEIKRKDFIRSADDFLKTKKGQKTLHKLKKKNLPLETTFGELKNTTLAPLLRKALKGKKLSTNNEQQKETKTNQAPKNETPIKEGKTDSFVSTKGTVEIPLDKISLSKDVPQFKSDANKYGLVEPLTGKFERTGVAPVQVWRRKNGDLELISGRHRFDLAKRSNEKTIPAQIHDEADGFTAKHAAVLDSELNIRDGQGKVKDYVNYFKSTGINRKEAKRRGLVGRALGKIAFDISENGTDTTHAAHRNDIIDDKTAQVISNTAPKNEAVQAAGLKFAQNGDNPELIANKMKVLSQVKTTQSTGDLFGFDDSAIQEAEQMANIVIKKQNELKRARENAKVGIKANSVQDGKLYTVNIKDKKQLRKYIDNLNKEIKDWSNWQTNPNIIKQIKNELSQDSGIKSEIPQVVSKPSEEGKGLLKENQLADNKISGTNKVSENEISDSFKKEVINESPKVVSSAKEKEVKSKAYKWFVDWSESNPNRTVETNSFNTLREAKEFAKGKYGYISRMGDDDSIKIHSFFGGYKPSANDEQKLKSLDPNYKYENVKQFQDDNVGSSAEVKARSGNKPLDKDNMTPLERHIKQHARLIDGEVTIMELHKTRHTKKDIPIWVVKLSDRISKDDYRDLNSKAKALGGYYSRYAKDGAIPGFQFKDENSAKKFMQLKEQSVSNIDKIEEKTGNTQRKSIERLRNMADRLHNKAEASLNRERKTNTAKRARKAASAGDAARSDIAFAETIRNLADGIETGKTKFLQNIKTKTQIEELISLLNRAKYKGDSIVTKDMSYSESESVRNKPATKDDIQYAEYPEVRLHKEDVKKLVFALENMAGMKFIAKRLSKLMPVGDMVTLNTDDAVKIRAKLGEDAPWQIEDAIKSIQRLKKIGINNSAELRAALRELIDFKEKKQEESPNKPIDTKKSIAKPPATGSTVKDVLSWLPKKVRKNIKIVQSINDLPGHLKSNALSGVEGLYDPVTNKSYIVADMITKDNALSVVAHELLHHRLANNKSLRQTVSNIEDVFNKIKSGEYKGRYKEVYEKAMERVKEAKTTPEDELEEFIAYSVTVFNENPKSLPAKLYKAIQKLIAAIKTALMRMGIQINKLTPADYSSLALQAVKQTKQNNILINAAFDQDYADSDNLLASYAGKKDQTADQSVKFSKTFTERVTSAFTKTKLAEGIEEENKEKYGVFNNALGKIGDAATKYLTTLDNLARNNPVARPFLDMAKSMQMKKDKLLSKTNDAVIAYNSIGKHGIKHIVSSVFDPEGDKSEQQRKVDEALLNGTLNNEVYNNTQLRKFGLDDKSIEVYKVIRQYMDDMTEEYKDALLERMRIKRNDGKLKLIKPSGKKDKDAAKLAIGYKLLNDFKELKGFFPIMRFGEHTITAKNDEGKIIYFAAEESKKKAIQHANKIKPEYDNVTIGFLSKNKRDDLVFDPRMLNMLGKYQDEIPGFSDIFDKVEQDILKDFSNSEFKKHFIHRKGTAGFSKDIVRTLANYGWSSSNYISKMLFVPKLQTYIDEKVDKHIYPKTKDHLQDTLDYIKAPNKEYQGIKSFTFMYYMGLNVKSAVVNLTQIPFTLGPFLANKFGDKKTFNAIRKVWKTALKEVITVDKDKNGNIIKNSKYYLHWAQQEGLTFDAFLGELIGAATGKRAAQVGLANKAIETATLLFSKAEMYNRRISVLAAYELTKTKSLKEINEMLTDAGHEAQKNKDLALKEFIKLTVTKTQFDYAKFNRPASFRGWGSVPLQFHQFLINYLQFIAGNGGGVGATVRSLGAVFLFAGLMGLPGADDLRAALEYAYTKVTGKHIDLQLEARKELVDLAKAFMNDTQARQFAEAALYGAPSLTPFDISGSVGIGKIGPGLVEFFDTAKEKGELEGFNEFISEASGSSFGIAKKALIGIEEYNKSGDLERLFEKTIIQNTAIQNVLRAFRMAIQGVDRNYAGKISIAYEPDVWDTIAQALSFTPGERKRLYRQKNTEYRESAFLKMAHQKLLTRLSVAMAVKDKEQIIEARRLIFEWNKEVPYKWRLSHEKIKRSMKMRSKYFDNPSGDRTKALQIQFKENAKYFI